MHPATGATSSATQERQEGEQEPNQEWGIEELGAPAERAQEKKKLSFGDFEEDVPPPNVIACRPSQLYVETALIRSISDVL